MPTHKGIEISVISQMELQALPEFPHPESSQFTYRSPGAYLSPVGFRSPEVRKGDHDWTPPSASSDSKADRLLGRPSTVSVYIPSGIGLRFWIHYNVLEPRVLLAQWFYFKLYMNGRLITSWGINALTHPEGKIMRGLFEPSAEFNYINEDGTIMEKGGAESRSFFFSEGPEPEEDVVAALDGGLIEVMVFRARGRRRRVQEPSLFKTQEGYGIVMPSEGLIPNPEDAKYYDWHLEDPKDNPFAIFKFHYRSWDTLKSLQLLPEGHPMDSYQPTDGYFSDCAKQVENEDEDSNIIDESSPLVHPLSHKTPFDDSPNSMIKDKAKQKAYPIPPMPKNSPFSEKCSDDTLNSFGSVSIRTSRISAAQIEKVYESPSWKNFLPRPLPELPTRKSSIKNPSGHSRQSSNVSSVPSVTPSLQSYVDRQENASPEPEVGVADVLQIIASTPSKDTEPANSGLKEEIPTKEFFQVLDSPTHLDNSESSVEISPCITSTSATKRRGMSSPPPALLSYLDYPVLTPNITLRKTRRSPSINPLKLSKSSLSDTTPIMLHRNSAIMPITISEGEWMARSPSPLNDRMQWSPIPGEKNGKGKERAIVNVKKTDGLDQEMGADEEGLIGRDVRKKAMAWFEKIRGLDGSEAADVPREEEGIPVEVPNPLKPMPGNWI